MRKKIGDYKAVLELFSKGEGGGLAEIKEANKKRGDYYAERNKWEKAAKYYMEA